MQKKLLRIKWVLITFIFFIILSPICKALEIPVLHTNYRNYTYNCNSKQMPLYNFYDYEREKAVYQIRGNEGYIDDVGFRQIIGDINYPLDLINALYLATNEEKITDDNIDKRIAMQLYIYDRYAKSNSDKITYDFNTSSYTKIQEQLLKEGQEMIKEKDYNYELKTGEWQFIPYPLEEREQLDLFPIEIKEAENGFYVKSELEGHYDVEIPLKDKAYLALNFMSTHPKKASYVEILKPCLEISNFHFEVSPSIYEIHVPENQIGYQLEVEENAKKDQLVNYNLTIEDKYELKEINITKEDNTSIPISNQSFIMPNEDVYFKIDVSQNIFNINVKQNEKAIIDCPKKAQTGETVKVNIKVDDEYELVSILVNGEKIENDTFIMPDKDVTIEAIVEPKKYNIYYDKGIVKLENNEALPNTIVKFVPQLNENYEVESITVRTLSGKIIEEENYEFVMPNEDVIITVINKQVKFYVKQHKNKDITLKMNETYHYGEKVKINYETKDNVVIKKIAVKTELGEDILLEDNTFIMPQEDVVISFVTAKTNIKEEEKEIPKEETESEKNNKEEKEEKKEETKVEYQEDPKTEEVKDEQHEENKDEQQEKVEEGKPLDEKNPNGLYRITFLDETFKELFKDIYVQKGSKIYVPGFYDWNLIKIIDDEGNLSYVENEYLIMPDSNITLIYTNPSYYYDEIPNTYESGYNPLIILLGGVFIIYAKKYFLN